jgi:tetratricopeptide (TPR) repeat protein
LFEELTCSALAKAALQCGVLPAEKIVRFPRKSWFLVAAAIAALVLIALAVVKPWRTEQLRLPPVLALGSANGQPVLLASGLQPTPTSVFRSPETDSRAPQTVGSIVSIEEGLATIDLGSLDGLAKDSELQVFRDDQSTEALGRLQVTTVFRQRARGRILDGKPVRAKDRVRVDDSARLEALSDQVAALYNRGEADAAQTIAEQATRWVETANVSSAKQSAWWNQLAVLRMLRGDYLTVETFLSRAGASSPKNEMAYARTMNNLGVLSEMRGDRRQAESRYADAVQAIAVIANPPEQERRAIEANLARLRGLH